MEINVNLNLTIGLSPGLEVLLEDLLKQPTPEPGPPAGPSRIILTRSGGNMPITVDTTNETVALSFVDDKGDAVDAPAGATVTFTTDNPQVATITQDPANPYQGDITPTGVGTVNVAASVTGANDASGNPLPNPDPVSLQVNPGAPAGERLSLSTP